MLTPHPLHFPKKMYCHEPTFVLKKSHCLNNWAHCSHWLISSFAAKLEILAKCTEAPS